MQETIETLNYLFALGGIALMLAIAIIWIDYFTSRSLEPIIKRFGLTIAFLLSSFGAVMTLIYSELFGFVPCGLCWLQRVFLYPQVLLLGTALFIRDKTVAIYGITLSLSGAFVALYQHYLQMGGSEFITCPTAGAGADCAKRILFEFGFMTFPLLSAITFIFLASLYFYYHKAHSS